MHRVAGAPQWMVTADGNRIRSPQQEADIGEDKRGGEGRPSTTADLRERAV